MSIVLRYWIDQDYSTLAGIGRTLARRVCMTAHMSLGALSMVLGPFQFWPLIRRRWPVVHRWTGRVYVGAALLCAVCGQVFICLKGFVLVGGVNMGLAFSTAGAVFFGCALLTALAARRGDFVAHRNWAIRAYSQVLSPMLYRYFYVILVVTGWYSGDDAAEPCGETANERDVCPVFTRTFDAIHAWTYFLVPLLVAECIVRLLPSGEEAARNLVVAKKGDNKMYPREDNDGAVQEEVFTDTEEPVKREDRTESSSASPSHVYTYLNAFGTVLAFVCLVSTALILIGGVFV